MKKELRDYQKEAVVKTYEYLQQGKGKCPVIEATTGAGKSLILSHIIKDCLSKGKRAICVTHVQELIKQNHIEFVEYAPEYGHLATIYSAGLGKKDLSGEAIFCGIGSIIRKTHLLENISLIIVDEADLISNKDSSQYRTFISEVQLNNPNVVVIGLTATPYRMDNGLIYGPTHPNNLFDGLSYKIDYKKLLELKYLVPIISKYSALKADLSGVRKSGGDYRIEDLGKAYAQKYLVDSAVKEICEYGKCRKSWIIFCCTIEHAKMVQEELQRYDVTSELITSETSSSQRPLIIKRFEDGHIKCLISVTALTVGFNVPSIDMVVMLRATLSTRLFCQAVGRGLRLAPNKKDCLLLDYGNNIITHGFLDDLKPVIKLPSQKKTKDMLERRLAKECKQCHTLLKVNARECFDCGYQYPMRKFIHEFEAYNGVLMTDTENLKEFECITVNTVLHTPSDSDKQACLRLVFGCDNFEFFDLYLQLPHTTDFKDRSKGMVEYTKSIIRKMGGKATNIEEAMKECKKYTPPKAILVDYKNNKFKKIVDMSW